MGRSVSILSLDGELIECNLKKKKKKERGKKEGIETEKDDIYWKCKSIVMKMEKQSHLMRVVIRSAIICIESFDRLTPVFSLSGNNSSLTPIPFLPLKIRVFLNDSLPTSRMEIR